MIVRSEDDIRRISQELYNLMQGRLPRTGPHHYSLRGGGIYGLSIQRNFFSVHEYQGPSYRLADGSPAFEQYGNFPGKAGLADFGADSGERYIDVSCNVYPQKTFAGLVAVFRSGGGMVRPYGGDKTACTGRWPDRYFMARLSDTVDCERLLRAAGSFTLRFLCPDPYGYALDDETFTLSQAGEHEVEREIGNTDSEPVYSLQGTISSGAVVLTTNGENLRVVGPLAAGEVLVIDTGMVTAKVTDSAGNTPCETACPVWRS